VRRKRVPLAGDLYHPRQAALQHTLRTVTPLRTPDFAPFEPELSRIPPADLAALDGRLCDATIPELQRLMEAGTLTAAELTLYYVARLRRYDVGRLQSVVELNPEALAIAAAMDAERRAGKTRGPLHGIPVLIKDNIGTGDRMHTTAGAAVLLDARADRDAFIVTRLREAGAVLLGKTNLSEWANFMSDRSSNGYSTVGGQTRNPYGRFDIGGSSSGSGASIAARFAAAAIGTETYGSIISPSGQCSLVGHKPTHGLVSRDKIIPITDATDTAGPMARNVIDASILLHAIAGQDANDPATAGVSARTDIFAAPDFGAEALRGARVGWLQHDPRRSGDTRVRQATLAALRRAGATVVEVPFAPPQVDYMSIFRFGIRAGVAAYLAATGGPVESLDDVIAFNRRDLRRRARRGQQLLIDSAREPLSAQGYTELVRTGREVSLAAVRSTLAEHRLDFLMSFRTSFAFNMSGAPLLSLPAGYLDSGEPIGLLMSADLGRDGELLAAGRAFELASRARRDPVLR
jgi:amidase